ncbi:MAG: ABC transporter substrate-binding protein, partial [Pseudomonadota bacterium]|nr:ABC transporter substrate-binding protein [Pseudomonadota bacterium]
MVATAAALLLDSASGAGSSPASPPSAQRIVSLSPHVTELLFAVGAGDQLVGVDDASDYPPAARRIPKVGEASALDLEALVQLTPTLVITWKTGTPARLQSEFATLHLPVILTEQRRLADIG